MKISGLFRTIAVRACKNAPTALRSSHSLEPAPQSAAGLVSLHGTCMKLRSAFLVSLAALCAGVPAFSQTSCVAGTTTITGTVYAPNGVDPLPNVTVYVSNLGKLPPLNPGVAVCPDPTIPPPGSYGVGGFTNTNGTFSITGVPVSSSVNLVIVSGKWRTQLVIDTSGGSCTTPVQVPTTATHFPRNQSEGDIPKFAVATGSVDQVECVLRRVGVQDSEFTNPGGAGRIQLFQGDGATVDPPARARVSGGAIIDSTTPAESKLMGDAPTLDSYDVLMLPCEGSDYARPKDQLTNLLNFANVGGRVYSSHYAYSWMWTNGAFATAANWTGDKTPSGSANVTDPLAGPATVVTNFAEGRTLSDWLPLVGAAIPNTNPAQINLSQVKSDISGLPAGSPTQPWLTLNKTSGIMQFVFDTPIGQTSGQCGRVLYNEYHVEAPTSNSGPTNVPFPGECPDTAATSMTPQEKLLEYSLFELTDNGGTGSISPTSLDFGDEAVGFKSPKFQKVTFTNNSTFPTTVSVVATTLADFAVETNGCQGLTLKNKATCDVTVSFTPQALGARLGFLNIGSGSQTLQATLTGNGTPDLTSTTTTLDLGSVDVTASRNGTFVVTNPNDFAVPMPQLGANGDFAATSSCGSVPSHGSCSVTVVFTPTVYGPRTGTLVPAGNSAGYSALSIALTGNGWDYTMGTSPASGTVIAGLSVSTTSVLTPLAGFANLVSLKCTTTAPGSNCSVANVSFTPSGVSNIGVYITTTAQYAVVGYTGVGQGWLALVVLGVASMMWFRRRQTGASLLRSGAVLLLLAGGAFLSGCGDLKPAKNATPTLPGSYTYTITAADGVLSHSATYTLNVTAK